VGAILVAKVIDSAIAMDLTSLAIFLSFFGGGLNVYEC
jgi:hypothetical protein